MKNAGRIGWRSWRGLIFSLALAGLGLAGIYGWSEWLLHRSYDAPVVSLRAIGAPDLAEGERMARIVGCWDGCHGRVGEGGHWETGGLVSNTAPTLSQVLPRYDDAQVVRLIRYGIKIDGRSAVGMNSFTFWSLAETDLANIIAHLRMQPPRPAVDRNLEIGWRGRWALINGEWKVSAEQVDRSLTRWGDQPQTTALERGRYLASITCTECHGQDFGGMPMEGAPSLAILAAYSEDQFRHLMRTAEPVIKRPLDEDMQWVAGAPFTDKEISGLYQFLRLRFGLAP